MAKKRCFYPPQKHEMLIPYEYIHYTGYRRKKKNHFKHAHYRKYRNRHSCVYEQHETVKRQRKKTIILGIRRIRHYCPQIRIQVAAETTAIYLRTSYGVPTQFDT